MLKGIHLISDLLFLPQRKRFMDEFQEKISLLQEMIAFAVVDGELHDREYDLLR